MRIRRTRHSQIVWKQRAISGVANSPVAVRVLHGRHKPIAWKQKPLAGTVSGTVSESATVADSVTAVYSGNVRAAESVTLSDTDTYPSTTFGQTANRGRNPPIVWRQREAVATGTSYSGSFADALTLLDSSTANQAFSLSAIAESFSVTDSNSPVGGSSVVSVVEAETIAESISTVWAFNGALGEALGPVDVQDGQGGSPVGVKGAPDYGRQRKRIVVPIGKELTEFPTPEAAVEALNHRAAEEAEKKRQQDDDDLAFLLANL